MTFCIATRYCTVKRVFANRYFLIKQYKRLYEILNIFFVFIYTHINQLVTKELDITRISNSRIYHRTTPTDSTYIFDDWLSAIFNMPIQFTRKDNFNTVYHHSKDYYIQQNNSK